MSHQRNMIALCLDFVQVWAGLYGKLAVAHAAGPSTSKHRTC